MALLKKAFIVEIIYDNGVVYRFTSFNRDRIENSAIIRVGGSNEQIFLGKDTTVFGSVKNISATQQKISPKSGIATIGNVTVTITDVDDPYVDGVGVLQKRERDVTNKFRNELLIGEQGLRNKTLRILEITDFNSWKENDGIVNAELIALQVIHNFSLDGNDIVINGSDVQRLMRSDLFVENKTSLVSIINVGQSPDSIEVLDTSKFQKIYHGNSYSADPNQEIGYLRLTSGEKTEIISWKTKDSTKFYGVQRGSLGTSPQDWSDPDEEVEVFEVVYLELPVPKMIYALLTGKVIGDSTYQTYELPKHWHLGVSESFINTPSFINIGGDYWDFNDDSKGKIFSFEDFGQVDGKKFIEGELLYPSGLYAVVDQNGQYKLKRRSGILEDTPAFAVFDKDRIIKHSNLKYNSADVHNTVIYKWNYRRDLGRTNRITVFTDPESAKKHGKSEPIIVESKGIKSNRFSEDLIRGMASSFFDRYSGPTLNMEIVCGFDAAPIELGEVIRVNIPELRDITNTKNKSLDRSFEILSKKIDYVNGLVTLTLFSGTTPTKLIAPNVINRYHLPDSYYSVGTVINSTNFPGVVDDSNPSNTVIVGKLVFNPPEIHFSKQDTTLYEDIVLSCQTNLTIAPTGELEISNNVNLRVKGFLLVNGKITGVDAVNDFGIAVNKDSSDLYGQMFGVADQLSGMNLNYQERMQKQRGGFDFNWQYGLRSVSGAGFNCFSTDYNVFDYLPNLPPGNKLISFVKDGYKSLFSPPIDENITPIGFLGPTNIIINPDIYTNVAGLATSIPELFVGYDDSIGDLIGFPVLQRGICGHSGNAGDVILMRHFSAVPFIDSGSGLPPKTILDAGYDEFNGPNGVGIPQDYEVVLKKGRVYNNFASWSGYYAHYRDWGWIMGVGGDGGGGGAGLVIVCRGMEMGVSGKIDLSGGYGKYGTENGMYWVGNGQTVNAVGATGGNGAPGSLYVILDGQGSLPPSFNSENLKQEIKEKAAKTERYFTLNDGTFDQTSGDVGQFNFPVFVDQDGRLFPYLENVSRYGSQDYGDYSTPYPKNGPINLFSGLHKIQYLASRNIVIDPPQYAPTPSSISLVENLNTPKTPQGNLSTIEIYVTPPAGDNSQFYSHSVIRYMQLDSNNVPVGQLYEIDLIAKDETFVVLPSDGKKWRFYAYSVHVDGTIQDSPAISADITVSNVTPDYSTTPIDDPTNQPPQAEEFLPVPDVDGLEVCYQGHDENVSGYEVDICWRTTTDTNPFYDKSDNVSYWFNGEENKSRVLPDHFSHYEIVVKRQIDEKVLRVDVSNTESFRYTDEMNINDNDGIISQELIFEVVMVGKQGQKSKNPARLFVDLSGRIIYSDEHENFSVTNRGVGATAPNTILIGDSSAAEFDIGDKWIVSWAIPSFVDFNAPIIFEFGICSTTNESSKTVSWGVDITVVEDVDGNDQSLKKLSKEISNIVLRSGQYSVVPITVPLGNILTDKSISMHIQLTRNPSMNDPTSNPAMTYAEMNYLTAKDAKGIFGGDVVVPETSPSNYMDGSNQEYMSGNQQEYLS